MDAFAEFAVFFQKKNRLFFTFLQDFDDFQERVPLSWLLEMKLSHFNLCSTFFKPSLSYFEPFGIIFHERPWVVNNYLSLFMSCGFVTV